MKLKQYVDLEIYKFYHSAAETFLRYEGKCSKAI